MLKIIAGERKGAHLFTLEGETTRPLRGRVRESLFNMIQFDVSGRRVLDLFSGSGAVALEAISRGAINAVLIENNRAAIGVIEKNIKKLRYEDRVEVVARQLPDALHAYRPTQPFDLVFIMPPYNSALAWPILEALRQPGFISSSAIIVIEIHQQEEAKIDEEHWTITRDKTYGVTRLLMLCPKTA